MTSPSLAHARACVFDVYGTLLDLESGVARVVDALGDAAPPLMALWRSKQLEYTWLRSLTRRYADFAQVTADALEYACDRLSITDLELRSRLRNAFHRLAPYPDAADAVGKLRRGGLRTAVLSNGTPDMLQSALTRGGLASLLDVVLSVDSLAVYKPAPEVYDLACTTLGLPRQSLLFVSANAWDASGAVSAGLPAVWVNRDGLPVERLPDRPTYVVESLSAVPRLPGLGPRLAGVF